MKVPVLVNIPDGWELADEEPRRVKQGEHYWLPGRTAAEKWSHAGPSDLTYIILRRKLPDTVKVELPREIVMRKARSCEVHRSDLLRCPVVWTDHCRESAACREALKAEQQT